MNGTRTHLRPSWWDYDVEWLEPCVVLRCGRFTQVRVIRPDGPEARCDAHRCKTDRTAPVPQP